MSEPTGEAADANVSVHEGITYADREAGELELDLYLPDGERPPLVVYIHGGGWIAETRDNIPDPERYAAEWGCAIASVSYRLAEVPDDAGPEMQEMYDPANPTPRGTFPAHFVDVKAAIRWLRANAAEYGYDAERIGAWGSSAGGHLAMLAGVVEDVMDLGAAFDGELKKSVAPDTSGTVQAVVSWYGLTDFTFAADNAPGIPSLLLGGPASDHPKRFEQASPITHVSADSPPTLLMHGRADEVVAVEHSRRFFDALDEAGVNAVFYELHDRNHVWAEHIEDIESEREAMDLLTTEPTPSQSVYSATHVDDGGTPDPLLDTTLPAGPAAIEQFFARTIK
ncbi:alpha/beta hydrolase [Natrialba taiwanensis]|uniref:Esterase/lipase-like protein n=1 Tax=Natrialba taiwanensis DSM 12281 TaxID=1230458 RepID=M0A9W6_9EURY|nr:alpha/beta hydrolase [Natrialba taiwanensis]ELY94118.1 Esterase/lipase-like protein [Natrialba taiwanensis DSM 12281]